MGTDTIKRRMNSSSWKISIIAAALVNMLAVNGQAALDPPHDASTATGCLSCHQMTSTYPKLLPPLNHSPQDIDDTVANSLCWSCHNDPTPLECRECHTSSTAPYVVTHSSPDSTWTVECWVCHNQHMQEQNLFNGSTYGKYIRRSINLANIKGGDGNTLPGKSGTRSVVFKAQTGANSFADGEGAIDGICEACHTTTTAWQNDGDYANDGAHKGLKAKNCMLCHPHTQGFKADYQCLDCHADPDNEETINNARADVKAQFTGTSHHVQRADGSIKNTDCYQCHWEADSAGKVTTHHSATPGAVVDLVIRDTNTGDGADDRPSESDYDDHVVQYTVGASNSLTLNQHCLGCHNDDMDNFVEEEGIFGDGKAPNHYAWDGTCSPYTQYDGQRSECISNLGVWTPGTSVDKRYSQTNATDKATWGKYNGARIASKQIFKAYSAHGNAGLNQQGWDTTNGVDGAVPDVTSNINVACFDCHNSHGSAAGDVNQPNQPTTSYASATAFGGILKDTAAGKGGYAMTYTPQAGGSPADKNAYSPGAALCFDCHMQNSETALLMHLDEDSWNGSPAEVVDSSGSGNNGTAYGADALPGGGISGGAGSYNGVGDYVHVPSSSSLDITGPLSIEARVWFNAVNKDQQMVLGGGQYVLWVTSSNQLRFADSQGNGVNSSTLMTAGQWYHIVAVFSGTAGEAVSGENTKIYLNGVSDTVTPNGTWSPIGLSYVRIGNTNFDGLLDEVAIYRDALIDSDVQEHHEGLRAVKINDKTPWAYNATFQAKQPIMGYWDSPFFGPGVFGPQKRYPFKGATGNMGGHFGRSSDLSSSPDSSHQINGLCTPCHDPHGVSPSLGAANTPYAVPLLKGTFMTSPYKEDTAPNSTTVYFGGGGYGDSGGYGGGSYPTYTIDQNTFADWVFGSTAQISQSVSEFGGLCLKCHTEENINPNTDNTWRTADRIHNAVKGWDYNQGSEITKHRFTCSKCHTVHNSRLPRLMVTNCLNFEHRGQVAAGGIPGSGLDGGNGDYGGGGGIGRFPAGGQGSGGGDDGYGYAWSGFGGGVTCHDSTNSDTWPDNQKWNIKTPWSTCIPSITSPPSVLGEQNQIVLLHMDEASWNGTAGEVKDSSGANNNGTAYNGANTVAGGISGRAGSFNASSVLINYSPPMDNFTLEAWIKPTTTHEIDAESTSGTGGVTGQKYLFGAVQRGAVNGGVGISAGTNGISVYEHGDSYMPALAVYSGAISSTQWTHVVVVYAAKRPYIYVNGVLVRTGLQSLRQHVIAPVTVGNGDYGSFPGTIDEVAIYDTPLAAADILLHYQQNSASFACGGSERTITWSTLGCDSTSYVEYGLSTSYGLTAENDLPVGNHSVTLADLTTPATYHYRVRSSNANGEALSEDYTFTMNSCP